MATTLSTPTAPSHARSASLPSASHPLTLAVEEQLHRLRASEALSSSCSSSSSLCNNLSALHDLFECVDNLLQLPLTQQALSHPKWADEVLDGSLRLLDICGTTRDVLSQLKESLQQLESSLRRKRGGESGLATQVGAYMTFRKKINKTIHKCLADLKKMEKHASSALFISKDLDLVAIVNVLQEVEAITVSVFQSILSFVSGPKAQSKTSGWPLVSKLMQPKRIECEREEENGCSEMEKLDGALYALINCQKSRMGSGLQNSQNQLAEVEMNIQGLEDGLDCVFRRLIKTRVSFLNILNHH
ncbi:PREDICTED: uncharacterized protein LOC104587086 [Nelumbo nucifera]|uniref:Uncharacterized protein LOC104587086 n=2 Tax=Nelumbo nucifera TaxID=4432 RepID=A0A1U7YXP3_NELNU|nr:PREDICTED: uncharacterized protein LOC104587086 [Nelumbo nucifera]DAD46602.1 TPA_asm: hypothetical protein HUJ06_016539 [Nelumbo nucifera]